MLNKTSIVNKVKSQFPEFYSEYGSSFIDFIQLYYSWIEINEYSGPTKNIQSLLDIDETTTLFLDFFKKEYMAGLPERIIGNQRFLQKHILDLYRSKGSSEGFKLLFRLLYNKEIDIYIPGKDVFKLSHGKWIRRKYIEISDREITKSFENKTIFGEISNASAVVETYDRINDNGITNHVLWVSSIEGTFLVNEKIYVNFEDIAESPVIKGSAIGFNILNSQINFSVGDNLYYENDADLKFIVSELNTVDLNGIITPKVLKIGDGYRDGEITSEYVMRGANGSNVEIGYFVRPSGVYKLLTDELINPYANTMLDAIDYDMPSPTTDDIDTIIADAFTFTNTELMELYSAYSIAGAGYDDVVDIYATDLDILRLEMRTEDGTFYGNNAIIEGYPSFGTSRALNVKIVNSSFNYRNPIFITVTNGIREIYGQLVIGPVGVAEGYYLDTNSFLSADKYIHDSFYYQEYSYDIKIDEIFNKYFDILVKTVHPTGKKAFGNIRVLSTYNVSPEIETIFEEAEE